MKAVIMAGGFGTRLRPLTCNIPKPMVPVVNKPMIHHIVNLLKSHGFDDIVSLLFYHPIAIRNYFGDGEGFGVQMQYTVAEADFGTAGSVRNALDKLGDERVLIISGDVLTDFDLTAALEFHNKRNADATIVLTSVPNPRQFGVVIVDDEGNITRFLEKPSWGEVFSDTINTGIYILEHHVLDMIPYKEDYDFSKNLFPNMMQEEMKLCGYIADGYWRDVGTLEEYLEASMDILAGKVKVQIAGKRNEIVYAGEGSEIDADSDSLKGTVVVGTNAKIAASAKLINTVVGDNAIIQDGAFVQNSVIWNRCIIEENAQLTDCVVGYDTTIRPGATIAENVFISDRCTIGKDASLTSNIKLWPDKIVQDGAVLAKSLVWEDKWLKALFTDARITGSTNIEINPEFGAKVGAALGAVIGKGRQVLASRDPDNASRMIKRAIACGLMSAGVSVDDMQTTPVPMVRQELRNGKNAAGFHVRKSPYDKRSMDIIFFDGDGKDLPANKTKSIERQFFSEDFLRAEYDSIGRLSFPERTTESYRNRFFSTIDTSVIESKGFNVVIDYSFGIASSIFPNILGDMGANVVSLNGYIDSRRLTRDEDEFIAACRNVSTIVTSLSSDIGFLVDAGAEKIFVSDENGHFLSDERLLPMVAKLYLESQKIRGHEVKKIGCPIGATAEMDIVAAEYEVKVVRTPNTHGGMMNAILEDLELPFVGGTKGGFIFQEFSFATDAMYSIAKILELMALTGCKLGQVDVELPKLQMEFREIPCPWDAKGKVMRKAMRHSEGMNRQLIDGIKVLFNETTWVLLIPSKDAAAFYVYVEASSAEEANQLVYDYEQKVVQWRDNP